MSNKIYVCNIPYSVTTADLIGLFSTYGKVVQAACILDRETGSPKGYGFVEMEDGESTAYAIEKMNGVIIAGRAIKVSVAFDKAKIVPRPAWTGKLRGI